MFCFERGESLEAWREKGCFESRALEIEIERVLSGPRGESDGNKRKREERRARESETKKERVFKFFIVSPFSIPFRVDFFL